MRWSIRPCARCGEPSDMHATRKICVPCRINEQSSPEELKKRAAQQASAMAIRSGVLVRQDCIACSAMGRQQFGTSHGHHEDYSKPLDVVWLCSMHHRWAHRYGLEHVLRRANTTGAENETHHLHHLFEARGAWLPGRQHALRALRIRSAETLRKFSPAG
jgi:hypothetical protein